jgi:simple sugar transport system permease protein
MARMSPVASGAQPSRVGSGPDRRAGRLATLVQRPITASLLSLAATLIVFSITSRGTFLQFGNIASILAISAELAFLSYGVTLVMIQGDIDLSVSSVYGISALAFVLLARYLPLIVALPVVLAIAGIIGYVNAFVCVKRGVPSLIGTLGMLFFLRGMIYFFTQGFPRTFPPKARESVLLSILSGRIGNSELQTSIIWVVAATVAIAFVLRRTAYGNHVYAVGGDRELARYMGVDVDRVRLANFMICAMMAGFGGLISAARFMTVAATHGNGEELPAIASAVVGGTLLSGGYGNIEGTLVGVLLVSSLRSGLLLSGAPSYWYIGFMGIVLVLATMLNVTMLKKWLQR